MGLATQIPDDVRDKAKELYEREGLSWRSIGERLAVNPHTIRGWINRHGWSKSRVAVRESVAKGAQVTAKELGAIHAKDAALVIRNTIDDYKLFRTKVLGMVEKTENPQGVKLLTGAWSEITNLARSTLGLDQQNQAPNTLVQLTLHGSMGDSIGPVVSGDKPIDV